MGALLVFSTILWRLFVPNFGFATFGMVSALTATAIFWGINMTVVVLSIVFVYQNYKKSLFGDHGYLMFTLPVAPYMLLLAKIITALIWLNFIVAIWVLMYIITMLPWFQTFVPGGAFGGNLLTLNWVSSLFIHVNPIGFFVISLFFAVITLSNASVKARVVSIFASGFFGIIYFSLWLMAVGISVYTFGWEYTSLLWIANSFVFGLVACFLIVKLYKRMELR